MQLLTYSDFKDALEVTFESLIDHELDGRIGGKE